MSIFAGAYGDKRRAAAVDRLFGAIVERGTVVIRKACGMRRRELSAHRVLSSRRVRVDETVACLARRTSQAAAGRRVVVAQDTTEINFPDRQPRSLGPAGRAGSTPGFFIHAMVAVDADEDAVLGLVDAQIWTRPAETKDAGGPAPRRQRTLEHKESQRWLTGAETAAASLGDAREVVVVGDRESDIYALFARRPAGVQLLVRAAQNRTLDDGTRLFAASAAWPALGESIVAVPPRRIGERARHARVQLRATRVAVSRPVNGRHDGGPDSVCLTLVEAVETDPAEGIEPLHWRLLTTLGADTFEAAAEVVRLYRLRWRIEQTFRMLKRDGLRLDETQTMDLHRLFNLASLALGGAVRTIQLVDARDGSPRPASDVAHDTQIQAAKALGPTLEGATERQKNPHDVGSLAWMSWIIARLGGWNCYYKPPGPKTMHDGWTRFAAIAQGFSLSARTTGDV